jgi:menaquinone-dependent protoporphyrinogen oxidase
MGGRCPTWNFLIGESYRLLSSGVVPIQRQGDDQRDCSCAAIGHWGIPPCPWGNTRCLRRAAENPVPFLTPWQDTSKIRQSIGVRLAKSAGRVGIRHAFRQIEVAMRVAIFFATREGQTSKIANRIAEHLRAKAVTVDIVNVKKPPPPLDWSKYATAFVAASVHALHHEREMIEFVRRYRDELHRIGAVFVSVSMSEAGAEDLQAPAERRARSAADAERMVDAFIKETGWKPERYLRVAGALLYTQYNFLVRFVMKRISRQNGGPTDTSRDYEFTDWPTLDRFVDEVTERFVAGAV